MQSVRLPIDTTVEAFVPGEMDGAASVQSLRAQGRRCGLISTGGSRQQTAMISRFARAVGRTPTSARIARGAYQRVV